MAKLYDWSAEETLSARSGVKEHRERGSTQSCTNIFGDYSNRMVAGEAEDQPQIGQTESVGCDRGVGTGWGALGRGIPVGPQGQAVAWNATPTCPANFCTSLPHQDHG